MDDSEMDVMTCLFYSESIEGTGASAVDLVDRSWLKCSPVGKGNVDDFAPEAVLSSRAFRVV